MVVKHRRHYGGGHRGGGNLFTGGFVVTMFLFIGAGWFFFFGPGKGIVSQILGSQRSPGPYDGMVGDYRPIAQNMKGGLTTSQLHTATGA